MKKTILLPYIGLLSSAAAPPVSMRAQPPACSALLFRKNTADSSWSENRNPGKNS